MAQKSDAQLLTDAGTIKSETTANANTATRVGTMMEDIIDSKMNNDDLIDEDDMATDSATRVPSQQSVKAYVDAEVAGAGGTIDATPTNGSTNAVQSDGVFDALALKADLTAVVGVQDLYVDAAAMYPRVTNGCSPLAQTEMTTSLFNIQSLDFNQTTQQFAQFKIVPPRKWNNGTVTFVPYWTASSGTGTVQWGLSLGAYSNDDALTVALGTAQTSDDTLIATNDLHIGPESSAITVAGTPADADMLAVQISRNPASDTLNADAKLLGISIRFTMDAAKDS